MTSRRVIPRTVAAVVLSLGLVACNAPGRPTVAGPSSPGSSTADGRPGTVAPTTTAGTRTAPRTQSATSKPPSTAAPTTPVAAGRSFTVLGSGDVLLHNALWKQGQRDAAAAGGSGYDFNPLFASLKPAVSGADVAICHMETPVGPPDGPFSSFPIFSVPPQVAPALANLGYDSCSTASNHSIDKGAAGVTRTLDALDAAGIKHTGTARNPAEAARLNLLNVKGIAVAHLSYTFSFNGLRRPRGQEWLANYLQADDLLAEAKRAKKAGAAVVIVSLHWGTEYQHSPNAHQVRLAKQLLASPDVDLILGHHAHVVQPLERVGDKWVAYGMGNQVAWQNFAQDTRDGIMPEFTFTEVKPGVFRVTRVQVRAIHMWLDARPARVYDVAAALASPAPSGSIKRSCQASLQRTRKVLGQRDAFADGMVLVGG